MIEYEFMERLNKLGSMLRESSNYEYEITQEKDKSLKSLFEVKKQFIQLIKTFVKESWTKSLIEENIELVDKEFIMTNMHETRADLIYRVKDEAIYFILLEFQSTEDSNMPYRLLSYMLEIWRRYANDKLPVVIPCVLYTGNKKWKVKTFRSLFNVRKELEKYIPDFQYVLIDVNNYTDEELLETANLVTSVVYMAKSKDKEELLKRLEEIIELINKLNKEEVEAFVRWTEVMFFKHDDVYECFEEKIYKKREEKGMALADLVPGALELLKEKGRVEGIEKGRNIGKKETIIKIFNKKIGNKPSEKILKFIEESDENKINELEDKIFEISSWKEVEDILNKK